MLLEVRDLCTYFDTEDGIVKAVDGISFNIDKGQTLGIVGESGCGKSVTALSLLRLLPQPPSRTVRGEILFEGTDLLKVSTDRMQKIRGADISMVFQEPMTSLNPVYSIGFQIAEAIETHQPTLSKAEVKNKAIAYLDQVGIPSASIRYDDYPHQLSGGMRQRVMIAMALSSTPRLLIADEPTTALDVTIQAQILELIKNLQKELGMATILITHDLGLIQEMVDTVIVMYAGTIVEMAGVKSLFSSPLHPYTKGLLDSIPSGRGDKTTQRRLNAIPGNVPNPLNLPNGCRFQQRCAIAIPACKQHEPPLEEREVTHRVSCFEA